MTGVPDALAPLNVPTAILAALLVLGVIAVIKIGKVLLVAAAFGVVAGGVSLGQGNSTATAGSHAVIAFGIAAATLFLIKLSKHLAIWLLVTAAGLGAVYYLGGVGR